MSTRTVLIADDDPGLIRLLRTILESMSVQVRETYDATSALAMIQRSPPNVVILDISMPGGNGLSACEMLKTDKSMAKVPVIILSGRDNETTRGRCAQMGAHFVCKGPQAPGEIKRLVGNLLAPMETAGAA
jgi:two-component system alkaline phosphatase synthesis response regulator PhoP